MALVDPLPVEHPLRIWAKREWFAHVSFYVHGYFDRCIGLNQFSLLEEEANRIEYGMGWEDAAGDIANLDDF